MSVERYSAGGIFCFCGHAFTAHVGKLVTVENSKKASSHVLINILEISILCTHRLSKETKAEEIVQHI